MNRRKNNRPKKSAAAELIREQGERIRREEVDEYVKRKCEKFTFKKFPF